MVREYKVQFSDSVVIKYTSQVWVETSEKSIGKKYQKTYDT